LIDPSPLPDHPEGVKLKDAQVIVDEDPLITGVPVTLKAPVEVIVLVPKLYVPVPDIENASAVKEKLLVLNEPEGSNRFLPTGAFARVKVFPVAFLTINGKLLKQAYDDVAEVKL
jgi:hypothetical protein